MSDWVADLFERHTIRTVIDAGANIGGTVALWLEHGATNVLAVEPEPSSFSAIAKRFAGNPKVQGIEVGVSDRPSQLTGVNIFNCWTLLPNASTVLARAVEFQTTPPFDVKLTTIDDLAAGVLRELPDFIKIDVDGYDVRALRGAQQTIAARRPPIMLELSYLPAVALGDCFECELRKLYGLGYTISRIDPVDPKSRGGLVPYPTLKDLMRVFPWDSSFDVLAEPT